MLVMNFSIPLRFVLRFALPGLLALFISACAQTGLVSEPGDEGAVVRRGPPPDLSDLMSQNTQTLLGKMGQPTLLREEFDAQVWQYDHPVCVLFFYLYRDAAQAFTVSHIEARAKEGGVMDAQTCVKDQFKS